MAQRNRPALPKVPAGLHWRCRFFARTAPLWRRLGELESAVLRHDLDTVSIHEPIYIAGVPRSGSTLLTEFLSAHPAVTSHRYSDFPNVYTPFWRNWLARHSRRQPLEAVERAHGDRIMVTHESPEAVEEVLWMHFFPHLHDPDTDQVLDERTAGTAFERFYVDHIRKLLLVRRRERYLAKGNYNATRLRYLRTIVPDARFVVPVRDPRDQVASLIKQDRLFRRAAAEDARIGPQLAMSGHFEFGPARRAVCIGPGSEAAAIEDCWTRGDLVGGWAMYWNHVYALVLRQIEQDEALDSAVRIVRYEQLCQRPEETLREVLDHARLDPQPVEPLVRRFAASISAPDYYRSEFTPDELERIDALTRPTAIALGYDRSADHRRDRP